MKSTWKKVMSALLVLAMLAGVLAVPGQKAEAISNKEWKRREWRRACKSVDKEFKKFVKGKPFSIGYNCVKRPSDGIYESDVAMSIKASARFDKKVAKKYKLSSKYSFEFGKIYDDYDSDSKKEIKIMHSELRYLSKICSAMKKEYRQNAKKYSDYYRLMKYSPSEIQAEVLSDSLRKRIDYSLITGGSKIKDTYSHEFKGIYKKKWLAGYNGVAFRGVLFINFHADWIDTETDIASAMGYTTSWGPGKFMKSYFVMLVKDGSNNNKRYWKSVKTASGGQDCQYEKSGLVKKKYKRPGVSSKEYWGTMLAEMYPGQFSVGDGDAGCASMTVKNGTVIEIPQSYYVPDGDIDTNNGAVHSISGGKLQIRFNIADKYDDSAVTVVNLMGKTLNVTVLP